VTCTFLSAKFESEAEYKEPHVDREKTKEVVP